MQQSTHRVNAKVIHSLEWRKLLLEFPTELTRVAVILAVPQQSPQLLKPVKVVLLTVPKHHVLKVVVQVKSVPLLKPVAVKPEKALNAIPAKGAATGNTTGYRKHRRDNKSHVLAKRKPLARRCGPKTNRDPPR